MSYCRTLKQQQITTTTTITLIIYIFYGLNSFVNQGRCQVSFHLYQSLSSPCSNGLHQSKQSRGINIDRKTNGNRNSVYSHNNLCINVDVCNIHVHYNTEKKYEVAHWCNGNQYLSFGFALCSTMTDCAINFSDEDFICLSLRHSSKYIKNGKKTSAT